MIFLYGPGYRSSKEGFLVAHYDTVYVALQQSSASADRAWDAVPIFVAILALLFTAAQAWQQRRHDRISVRPLLRLKTDYADGVYSADLTNAGLGPALLIGPTATLAGEPIKLNSFISDLCSRFGLDGNGSYMHPNSGPIALHTGETVRLIEIKISRGDLAAQRALINDFSGLAIFVGCKDAYGKSISRSTYSGTDLLAGELIGDQAKENRARRTKQPE